MKEFARNFGQVFAQSSWFYTRPILAFDDRRSWTAIVLGIVLANITGILLNNVGELAFTLVNVGSFLGTVLCALPRHSHPVINSIKGIAIIAIGSSLGILFQHNSLFIIVLFCSGLYISGLSRNFSIGMYIRWLFGAIAVLAGGQLRGEYPLDKVLESLCAVVIGMSIVSIMFSIFSKHPNSSIELVTDLYEQLYLLSEDQDSQFVHTRIQVREYIEVMPKFNNFRNPWIYELVRQADQIAGSLRWQSSNENSLALRGIISNLKGCPPDQSIKLTEINPEIKKAILILQKRTGYKKFSISALFPAEEGFDELKDIILSYKGSSSRFALRLVLTGFVCHICSMMINHIYPLPLAGHEFWVALAGCLMVMPGSHGTMGKIASRTLGTITGAITGTFLSFYFSNLSTLNPEWHFIIACLLIINYETVRKMSQAFLMFSVTSWLTFVLGGGTAGFTRLIDVIIGAIIAFVIFLIFPTWHDQVLQKNISTWCKTISTMLIDLTHEKKNSHKDFQLLLAYRIQARVDKSIQEIILEKAIYGSKIRTDRLLQSQKLMEDVILQLIQIQRYLNTEQYNISSLSRELTDYNNRIVALSNSLIVSNSIPNLERRYFPFLDLTMRKLCETL